ncbi:homoserine dehydrogenase [candidate division KSB1 bacterium]
MLKLLFLGFGNVGQALAKLLIDKKSYLEEKYGFFYKPVGIVDINLGSVCNNDGINLEKSLEMVENGKSLNDLPGGITGLSALDAIDKINADVLLEATYTDIKTGEPATTHVKNALNKGMHVVTTNKGPVALFSKELLKLAADNGVNFLFEGTIMSGTPMLNLVRETLAGSDIKCVQGILNGTTNFILTKMEEGMKYENALQLAQELGYAEAVPDADVKGWDALAKATILANVIFNEPLKPDDIPCEGITGLTPDDIELAGKENSRYKLIARVEKTAGKVSASVRPQKMKLSHPLASVSGATNALTITSDTLGDVTISGPGAGRIETGFSMLIDLLAIRSKL